MRKYELYPTHHDSFELHSERILRSLTSTSSVESLRGMRANQEIDRIPYSRRFPARSLMERSGNPAQRGCRELQYYGNTEIVRIRKQNNTTIREDWLNFDSVEESMEYFNTECGEFADYYH